MGAHKSFPQAVLHVDGDSFFVSCEIASKPHLKGLPVVTGAERGIASAASVEAKQAGVTRGMSLTEVKKVCPEAVVLPSDYETYGLFSTRMYEIVRRYTPLVEEYSIDECFADLTGLRGPLHMSYQQIGETIKKEIETELGITVSVGVAPTKVLAKVGSNWNKPESSTLTVITAKDAFTFLDRWPVEELWGIGKQTASYLKKFGVVTAGDLARKTDKWVHQNLSKPYQELWWELQGVMIYHINAEKKETYKSISKTKTFTPPRTGDRDYVFAQLSKNAENACIKARRYSLAAAKVAFFIKTQGFRYHAMKLDLSYPTNTPLDLIALIDANLDSIFEPNTSYRATGVTLMDLRAGKEVAQPDLFGKSIEVASKTKVFERVDELSERYGKYTVFVASSLPAVSGPQHGGIRGHAPARHVNLLEGETKRKRISVPMMGNVK